MKLRPFADYAVDGLIIIILGAGCSVHFEPGPLYSRMEAVDLPNDPLSLLAISHAAYSPYGPISSVRLSLAASEKVLADHPQNELASFYCGRALTWLLEFDETLAPDEVKAMAEQGFERLRAAAERNADRVDYVFLAGALLGNAIRFSKVQGMAQIRRVHDYFQRAVDLDPSYDGGAPLRALGTLWVKAPPWPAGVGDVDGGIEMLEKATRSFPEHPANHLYLADALAAEDRKCEAAEAYRRVIDLCTDQRWGAVCDTYDTQARASLHSLQ